MTGDRTQTLTAIETALRTELSLWWQTPPRLDIAAIVALRALDVVNDLRAAQRPPAPYPTETQWVAEEQRGGEWEYLGTSRDRAEVADRLTRGAPGATRARMVRVTTTYTVEAPALAVARQILGTTEQPDVAERPRCPACRLPHDLTPGSVPMAFCASLAKQPAEAQPEPTVAAPITAAERQFLTFALDLAADEMLSRDGFTDADEAALATLRRLATPAATEEPTA